jgi:hypothetical protein
MPYFQNEVYEEGSQEVDSFLRVVDAILSNASEAMTIRNLSQVKLR